MANHSQSRNTMAPLESYPIIKGSLVQICISRNSPWRRLVFSEPLLNFIIVKLILVQHIVGIHSNPSKCNIIYSDSA